jgi:hypothetical protein
MTIGSAANRQAVDFDITDLSISQGNDLALMSLNYTLSLAPEPSFGFSGGVVSLPGLTVADQIRDATGAKNGANISPLPATVGQPAGHKPLAAATDIIQHKDVPGVQEGVAECLAGALARSIKWLDQEHNLESGKTAQQIFGDLRDLKVGSSGPGATTYEQDVAAKASYLKGLAAKKKKDAVTKVLDLDNAIGAVKGVGETTGVDLITWLRQELPTEDVELHYDGHIITVTGIYKQGGKEYIKYRDDEKQGDNTKGDTAEKTAELIKSGADYNFRRDGVDSKVKVVISESIKDEKPKGVNSSTPTLPSTGNQNGGSYRHEGDNIPSYNTPSGPVTLSNVRHYNFQNINTTPSGDDEIESFNSTLQATAHFQGGSFPMTLTGPVEVLVADRVGNPTGYFDTEILSMTLSSGPIVLPGIGPTEIIIRESPTLPSLGLAGVHDMFDGRYFIDSFFDVFTELSLDGGSSYYASEGSTLVALNVPEPSTLLMGLLGVAVVSAGQARRRFRT